MPDARDPMALVRHAVQVGDWRLVELLARVLAGGAPRPLFAGHRAYATLIRRLGMTSSGDYDRRRCRKSSA